MADKFGDFPDNLPEDPSDTPAETPANVSENVAPTPEAGATDRIPPSLEEPPESLVEEEVPIGDIPELDTDDLRADTLEFEPIRRRTTSSNGGLKLLAIIVVLCGGGYFAYAEWGDEIFDRDADELPIVRAPEVPLKIRPENPGGIDIPNRDKLVYDRLEKKPPEEKTENLLPRPEQPLAPPEPKPQDVAEVTAKPEAAPAPAVNAPPTLGAQPTPEEVKAAAKPAPAPTPPKAATQPEPKPQAAAKPVVTPKPAAPVAANPITSKSYQIQLAAVRNAAAAGNEWTRLQKKHNALLGNLKLNVVRADLGSKGIFYRLRAGPLDSQAAAKSLCTSLAKVKVGCLVIRPGK